MTGYDVYKKICALLGYSFTDTTANDRRLVRMQEIIEQISLDLKFESPKNLSQEIIIQAKKKEALIYGAAMMLAVTEGDSGKTKMFAQLYNSKRSTALCEKETLSDALPTTSDGGA